MKSERKLEFVVTGLPRSGLAWVANYLTYGNTLCVFDALKHGAIDGCGPDCIDKMLQALPDTGPQHIGIADHGTPFFQDYLIEKYPDLIWVFVDRPYPDIIRSVRDVLTANPDLSALADKLGELNSKVQGRVFNIHYDKLFTPQSIDSFAVVIDPTWSPPPERSRMLCELNVQMDTKLALEQAKDIPADNALSRAAEPLNPIPATVDYLAILKEICGEHHQAYDFLEQAVEAALFFDHVKDGDPVSQLSQDKVMKSLMVLWPTNQFVRQFAVTLTPAISMAIESWKTGQDYTGYVTLPSLVAFCIGGTEAVEKFAPQLRDIVAQAKQQDDARDND